jgi:hypothetical protein
MIVKKRISDVVIIVVKIFLQFQEICHDYFKRLLATLFAVLQKAKEPLRDSQARLDYWQISLKMSLDSFFVLNNRDIFLSTKNLHIEKFLCF